MGMRTGTIVWHMHYQCVPLLERASANRQSVVAIKQRAHRTDRSADPLLVEGPLSASKCLSPGILRQQL